MNALTILVFIVSVSLLTAVPVLAGPTGDAKDAKTSPTGNCVAREADLKRRASRLLLDFNAPPQLEQGGRIEVRWSGAEMPLSKSEPTFLVLATPPATRFEQDTRTRAIEHGDDETTTMQEGPGFLALTAEARAPFDIPFGKGRVRAVVPLSGPTANLVASLKIKPYVVGDFPIAWTVVARTECGITLLREPSDVSFRVKASKPRLIVQDDADVSRPVRVSTSPNRRYTLQVFENSYRVLDSKTGALLIEPSGRNPTFSRTSRFLVAGEKHTSERQFSELIDLEVLEPISAEFPASVDWAEGDTLSIWFGTRGTVPGAHMVVSPLIDVGEIIGDRDDLSPLRRRVFGFWEADPLGSGHGRPRPHFDLDELMVVYVAAEQPLPNPYMVRKHRYPYAVYDVVSQATECCGTLAELRRYLIARQSRLGRLTNAQLNPDNHAEGTWVRAATQGQKRNASQSASPPPKRTHVAKADTSSPQVVRATWRAASRTTRARTGQEGTGSRANTLRSIGIDPEPVRTIRRHVDLSSLDRSRMHWEAYEEAADALRAKSGLDVWNELSKQFPDVADALPRPGACQRSRVECLEGGVLDLRYVDQAWSWSGGNADIALIQLSDVAGQWGGVKAGALAIISREQGKPSIVTRLTAEEGRMGEDFSFDFQSLVRPALTEDGRLLLLFQSGAAALVCKLPSCSERRWIKSIAQPLGADEGLGLMGEAALQMNTDGQLFVYRLSDGARLLEGRIVDDEAIVWTPELLYDASSEGAHMVNLRIGQRAGVYSFHQFESTLRVAGLASRILAGETLPARAVQVPPQLKAEARVRSDGDISGEAIASSEGPVDAIQIYQDGVLTTTLTSIEIGKATPFKISRLPGAQWLSVLAIDQQGIASLPVAIDLGADPRHKSRLHVMTIGIGQYADSDVPQLPSAARDAQTVLTAIDKGSAAKAEIATRVQLTDATATKARILTELDKALQATSSGDTMLVSFSGHGFRYQDQFYLAAHDTLTSNVADTGLAWGELSARLRRSKARIVVLLDACHSGAAGTEFLASNDDAVDALLAGVPSNIVVIAASKGRELSYESSRLGGGVFSTAFASVISSQRSKHDLNRNGAIEISELFLGIKRKVLIDGRTVREDYARSHGLSEIDAQTPWIARNKMVGDFALF
ncbi:MAG: caspase domain-containing protein [Hyphomicrobiaceae bacterium]